MWRSHPFSLSRPFRSWNDPWGSIPKSGPLRQLAFVRFPKKPCFCPSSRQPRTRPQASQRQTKPMRGMEVVSCAFSLHCVCWSQNGLLGLHAPEASRLQAAMQSSMEAIVQAWVLLMQTMELLLHVGGQIASSHQGHLCAAASQRSSCVLTELWTKTRALARHWRIVPWKETKPNSLAPEKARHHSPEVQVPKPAPSFRGTFPHTASQTRATRYGIQSARRGTVG